MSDDAELKKAGLKVTLPRLRILELLEHDDKTHLSAEEIYRRLLDAGEEVGLATVYRVLTQFEQLVYVLDIILKKAMLSTNLLLLITMITWCV